MIYTERAAKKPRWQSWVLQLSAAATFFGAILTVSEVIGAREAMDDVAQQHEYNRLREANALQRAMDAKKEPVSYTDKGQRVQEAPYTVLLAYPDVPIAALEQKALDHQGRAQTNGWLGGLSLFVMSSTSTALLAERWRRGASVATTAEREKPVPDPEPAPCLGRAAMAEEVAVPYYGGRYTWGAPDPVSMDTFDGMMDHYEPTRTERVVEWLRGRLAARNERIQEQLAACRPSDPFAIRHNTIEPITLDPVSA